jgi:hypothetical protein
VSDADIDEDAITDLHNDIAHLEIIFHRPMVTVTASQCRVRPNGRVRDCSTYLGLRAGGEDRGTLRHAKREPCLGFSEMVLACVTWQA